MKRVAFAAVSALALSIAAPALAAPAAPATISVPKLQYKQRTLANGLKVYTIQDTGTANVTVQVWYDVGAKDDPEGRSGFAHLFEHILSRKTVNLPFNAINKLTEDVGGTRNASTGMDFTNYYETVPAQYLETMLWTHAERMARPVVDQQVFEAERNIVKEELRQRVLSTPYGRLQRFVLQENAFDTHPYRRPGIGSIEQLNAATIDDARAFHEAYYRPDTATLIVAGNFDQKQLDAWVDKYFAGIEKPGKPVPRLNAKPDAPRTTPRQVTAYAPNVPLPAIAWIYQAPKAAHPDTAALSVLDAILSRGESSRLYKAMVYDKQVAVSAATFFNNMEDAGFIAPMVTLAGGKKVEEAEAALATELARVRDELVTPAELAEAKNELVADELRSRETASGKAFLLGNALVSTSDPTTPDHMIAEVQKVTAEDVRRVARKYLNDQGRVSIRYFDESQRPAGQPDAWANPTPMPKFLTVPAATKAPNELAAEDKRQQPPAPGAARPVAKAVVAEKTLPNGLRVIAAKSSDVPLVAATLVIGGGSAVDPARAPGVANMAAELVVKGTKTRTAPQLAAEIEALGAQIGGGAGPDGTALFVSAPITSIDKAGAILSDVVINPAFAPEELERQRKQALDVYAVGMKNPATISSLATGRTMYGSAPYGAPASGTESSLKALTRDDLVGHHQTWWRPDNATLVLSGGMAPEAAFAMAERLFGGWTAQGPAPVLPAARAGAAAPARVVVIDLPNAGQAAVTAAVRAVDRKDPAFYPLSVGNAVLGGGSNGRLFQEVRVKRALSYGAYSGLTGRQDEGLLTASAQTKNESAAEVADLFLSELARLAKEPGSADDVERRKAFLTGNFARQIETSTGLGAALAGYVQQGLPVAEMDRYVPSIQAVTPDQIGAAVAADLPAGEASLVIVGDAKLFLDALKAKHPNVEVIPVDQLDLDSPTLRKGGA